MLTLAPAPITPSVGVIAAPGSVEASSAWVWAGICWTVSVSSSVPPDLADRARAQARSLAVVDGEAAAQVRQRERGLAVAAVDGADQREQGVVLGDRYQLSVAEGPAVGREIAGEHPDLADE